MRDSNQSAAAARMKLNLRQSGCTAIRPKWIYRLAAHWFGGLPVEESVVTKVRFEDQPEAVWRSLMTYEEIPVKAPLVLRVLLPQPVGTFGDKTRPGEQVPCTYVEGGLVKAIQTVKPPHELTFAVVDQNLGFEACAVALGGAYRIDAAGAGSQVALSSRYLGKLHPRFFWRRIEHFLAHLFHRHVLRGMEASMRGEL